MLKPDILSEGESNEAKNLEGQVGISRLIQNQFLRKFFSSSVNGYDSLHKFVLRSVFSFIS